MGNPCFEKEIGESFRRLDFLPPCETRFLLFVNSSVTSVGLFFGNGDCLRRPAFGQSL